MDFSIKDDLHIHPEMMKSSMWCSLLYLFILIASVFVMFVNRKISSDEWPVPDNVVLHNVIPFDSDNQLYRVFAENEDDLLELMYGDKVDASLKADAMGLTHLQIMQYMSGCAPHAVLEKTAKSILSGPGNVGEVLEEVTTTGTTLKLKAPMTNLAAGEHLAIYQKSPYKVEFVTATDGGSGATIITIARNQDLSTSGLSGDLTGTAGTGYKILADSYVYRVADETGFKQPYELAIPTKANMATEYAAALTTAADTSLCKCLNDAQNIVDAFASDAAITKGHFNSLTTATTQSDSKLGNTLVDGVHDRRGIRDLKVQKKAVEQFIKDLESDLSHNFKIRAVDSCLANYIPEYTIKYKGVIDTRHIGDNGQYLLYLGILTVMINTLYHWSGKDKRLEENEEGHNYDANTGEQLFRVKPFQNQFGYRAFAYFLLLCIAGGSISFLVLNYYIDHHNVGCETIDIFDTGTSVDDKDRCRTQRDLLNNRPSTYSQPYLVLTTLYHVTSSFAYGLIAFFALIRLYNYAKGSKAKDGQIEYFWILPETAVMRRIGTDVPFITGYACLGTALLAQAGVQDLTSLMFSFTILFITGFLQHISNVCKLMYDSLCKHTSGIVMEMLFRKEQQRKDTFVSETLQFFGWSRLFMFFTIGLTTLSFMTMTRETVESNHVQTFTNGQVFYFALAFFWSNISYDVVRELIPFTFERVHMDHSKVVITLLYLLYYNVNMNLFADQMKSNNRINHFSLHSAHST